MQPVTKSRKKFLPEKATKETYPKSNRPCQPHRLHVKRIHTLSSFQRWGRCSFRSHRKCPMCTHRHRMALFTQQHLEVWNFYLLLLSYWTFHSHFIIVMLLFRWLYKTQWESWKMWICRKRNKEMKAAKHGVIFFSCQTRECERFSVNLCWARINFIIRVWLFSHSTRDARLISSIFYFYCAYIWNWTNKKAHVYHRTSYASEWERTFGLIR